MRDRGALLGPEESGRPGVSGCSGFSGSLAAPTVYPFGDCGWCGGVAGASLHQTVLVWCLFRGVFSLGVDAGGAGGGWGWCSCPYFENCIVDASIFVVFCCVTSY